MSDCFDKSIVICTPSESLNSYGIFKDGHFVKGGQLKEYQVPHTNNDLLNFTKQHNIRNEGDTVLFNCGGEFFGVFTNVKISNNLSSWAMTYKEKVMSPSQVRKFMLKQNGDKDWRVKNYFKETKDWSDPVFDRR